MKLFLMGWVLSGLSQWLMPAAAQSDDGDKTKKCVVVVTSGDESDGDVTKRVVIKKSGKVGDDGVIKWVTEDGDVKTIKVGGTDGPHVVFSGDDGNAFVVGDGDGTKFRVLMKADGDPAAATAYAVQVGAEGANDGRSGAHAVFAQSDKSDKNRGWLGVSIESVPEALAVQLDIEGRGVLISNVVEDSPADKAGLEAHDVVLSVDGTLISGDSSELVKAISSRQPGDEVTIVVLREGREREIDVVLGERAENNFKFDWKFEGAPDADIEDRVFTRGRMMHRGDDGAWVMQDLGELEALKNLPHNVQMFLPKTGNRSMKVFTEGGQTRIMTKVVRDGEVIVVEQDGDGEITVSRVDQDGNETKETYESADELKDADADAFELLENSNSSIGVHVNVDGLHLPDIDMEGITGGLFELKLDGDTDFAFDSEDFQSHMAEWKAKLEESLSAAGDAHEIAVEELEALMEKLKSGAGSALHDFHFSTKDGGSVGSSPHVVRMSRTAKASHSFKVLPDGTIEVTIRSGDSELVKVFEDADDLADRRPSLYKKYEKLLDIDEDE